MKIGLYYEDFDNKNLYKVENHTKSSYVLYSQDGELLTISKPCAYRYAVKRVNSKKRISKFEDSISKIIKFKRKYIDSIIVADNNLKSIDGDLKVVWETKNIEVRITEGWKQIDVLNIKKNDVFRIINDDGSIYKTFRGQSEFLAYSDSYCDNKYKYQVNIDYIYKEY